MKTYIHPDKSLWAEITARPQIDSSELSATVSRVLEEVRTEGDEAVRRYEEKFDHAILSRLAVSEEEKAEAEELVSDELKDALELAHRNIARFHESERFEGKKVETCKGVVCWQKSVAIEKVGLYIPGGTAPLFSTVLMLATPAKIAGCREIIMCTPPGPEGKIAPAILVAARIAGVSKIYKTGGIQAIGAMAYGTASIPKVSKIFGPGNRFVMTAKQQVSLHGVAIDMPAGPSEVCVIADGSSNAEFVAADLLSQAEHGADSQVLLITTDERKADEVKQEINRQMQALPRRETVLESLEHSRIVVVSNSHEAIRLANAYAPEHLILNISDYEEISEEVINAGSVFLGQWACESAGDYASGTNHTLPTHGYATAYSGVNLDSFCRKITFQHIDAEGVASIGKAVELLAEGEQLQAHSNAMKVRAKALKS